MFGSGLNLVSAALGFGMTAVFIAFVCARFICCRSRDADDGTPPPLDFHADVDRPVQICFAAPQETVSYKEKLRRVNDKPSVYAGTQSYINTGVYMIEHARCGLEPLVVAAIPTMKYNSEFFQWKDDAQCSICLGEYNEKEILRIIPTCHHNFHLTCLDEWLQKQTSCPICRVSLKEHTDGKSTVAPAHSIPQLAPVPENSVNPTPEWFLPLHQGHAGQQSSPVMQESVEVVIEFQQ